MRTAIESQFLGFKLLSDLTSLALLSERIPWDFHNKQALERSRNSAKGSSHM